MHPADEEGLEDLPLTVLEAVDMVREQSLDLHWRNDYLTQYSHEAHT